MSLTSLHTPLEMEMIRVFAPFVLLFLAIGAHRSTLEHLGSVIKGNFDRNFTEHCDLG